MLTQLAINSNTYHGISLEDAALLSFYHVTQGVRYNLKVSKAIEQSLEKVRSFNVRF